MELGGGGGGGGNGGGGFTLVVVGEGQLFLASLLLGIHHNTSTHTH